MQPVDIITDVITNLETALKQERSTLFHLRQELLQRSVELAFKFAGDYSQIADQTLEIRTAIAHAEQALAEIPEILNELYVQLELEQQEGQKVAMQADRQLNDELFHNELRRIIEAGQATPAELLQLRRYAAGSSNKARKYDIDSLIEALDDHDRRVKSALAYKQEPPVFAFELEENGGKR